MSNYEELTLSIQGVSTRVFKGGSGPPLVYWHGAGGTGLWFAHHAMLAQHFTVYAPEHPGWGGSETVEWMDTIYDYVLHYDALFRELAIEKPVLVGHSLGGWIASLFASTYVDRLAALALIDSAGFPFTEEDEVPDFFAVAARGGIDLAQMVFHKLDVAMAYFPAQPTLDDYLRFFREQTSTARIAWHIWFDDKMSQRLARVRVPTLVIWGKHDRLFPLDLGRRMAEAIPTAQFRPFDDCGHMVPFEDPAGLTQAIVELYQEAQS